MVKKKLIGVVSSIVLSSFLIFTGCTNNGKIQSVAGSNEFKGKNPKYVFLFIGDGMGMTQINSAEIYLGNKKDSKVPNVQKLNFTQFPVEGINTTYASDSFIPDSASAGTAIATGNKTSDGVISMDPSKKEKYKSMAEIAKENGMKVGIVSSVSLDHATPAVFYAHQPSRNNYYDIEIELGKSNFDYFAGGGFKQPTGSDKNKPDAFEEAKKNGYKVVNTKDDFEKLDSKDGKVIAISPKLDSEKAIPFSINNDKEVISLADFTKKGIEVLDNNKGFFMMVEGGKVDWACHANDAASSINEVIGFDNSIVEAMKFYEKHPDETLIVVTADHETGGFSIGFAGTGYETFFNKLSNQKISYDEFTKKIDEYRKSHTQENAKIEDLLPLIKENYGLEAIDSSVRADLETKVKAGDEDAAEKLGMVLNDNDISSLKEALKQSMIDPKARTKDEQSKLLYGGYDPVTVTLTHILNSKAGIAFTSYAHTGVPVGVYAKGVGQEMFGGYFDDTDLNKKLLSIMGISKK
ncbi:alkaline phosphatase [Clostridium polyendosporum]|uniref:Alkaline phosphatase n=1 Tax=Clostridium polyendosporum TaxID=69208 RepID=A0A919RW59_9CLOT|nr:alkaline phosphatase [Clostridium polyendosporum]GIM27412.1 alkaline phosphatase [Clostridium polyendosporum]